MHRTIASRLYWTYSFLHIICTSLLLPYYYSTVIKSKQWRVHIPISMELIETVVFDRDLTAELAYIPILSILPYRITL